MTRDEAYREAERKIEEAGRSQSTELNLSYMGLTALPESIGNLSQLQKLSLSYNQLTEVPSFLGNLSQLQRLSLSNNKLTKIPSFLGNLSQLQTLYLDNNPLKPELAAAYQKGVKRLKAYLREKQKNL